MYYFILISIIIVLSILLYKSKYHYFWSNSVEFKAYKDIHVGMSVYLGDDSCTIINILCEYSSPAAKNNVFIIVKPDDTTLDWASGCMVTYEELTLIK